MRTKLFTVITFLLTFPLVFLCSAKTVNLHFSSISQLAEQEVARIVLPQIYQQIGAGYRVSISPMPAVRAQYEANNGIKDGEILRIYSYGEETPNVIRVPTPYYSLTTAVFARKDSQIEVNSQQDLAHYRVGKVRGVKHTENATKGLNNVYDSPFSKNLFQQLNVGNIDVAITNYQDGLLAIKNLALDNIKTVNPAIAHEPLYHYLHKKHHALVGTLDEKIKDLQRSGKLDDIVKQAEQKVYK